MKKESIIDTNILMSNISKGTTTILNIIEYPKAVEKDFNIIWPTKQDYLLALEIMVQLLKKGKPIPTVDVILASICINNNRSLRTKDKHFKFIQEVAPEFEVNFV